MSTSLDSPQHQAARSTVTAPMVADALKSSEITASTAVESSEEFTLSSELMSSVEEVPVLQLSNMAIVEEHGDGQRSVAEETDRKENDNPGRVRFAEDVYYITEDDLKVPPPKELSKKKNKKLKKQECDEHADCQILPQDVWWSLEELKALEVNAMYMVKESKQYQEEVICSVLYNKAFLSAANQAKAVPEDQLFEFLQDVAAYCNTLESWTAVGHSRRGLENMVSDKASADAVQCRMVLLRLQKELRESAAERSDAVDAVALVAQHEDALAQKCKESSRTARIMARMMGQADSDSLIKADTMCAEAPSLPEPPGRYSGDHEVNATSERIGRRDRRGSIIGSVKKAVGKAFARKGSREVNMRRIRKIQQRHHQDVEPPKRRSEEFRKSFLDTLDYGEQ